LSGLDKAALDLGDGRPLLARVIDRLAPWPGPVLVGGHAPEDRSRLMALAGPIHPITVVSDPIADFQGAGEGTGAVTRAGPLAGLLAALEAVTTRHPAVSWMVSVPVDLPFVPGDLLAGLWRARTTAGAPGACVVSGERQHFLVALWPVPGAAAALRRAMVNDGLRRVGAWVARQGLVEARWPDLTPDAFLNINDPDTLAQARAYVASERLRERRSRGVFP